MFWALQMTFILTAFYVFLMGGEFSSRTCSFDPDHELTNSDVSICEYHRVRLRRLMLHFLSPVFHADLLASSPYAGLQEPLFTTPSKLSKFIPLMDNASSYG